MKKLLSLTVLILIICAIAAGTFLGFRLFEGQAPEITVVKAPQIIGNGGEISVRVRDNQAGIRLVEARVVQGNHRVPLGEKAVSIPSRWTGSPEKEMVLTWQINPRKEGLSPGKATLVISAFDASLRNGSKGNQSIMEIPLNIDYIPPVITVLSTIHNIRVGGSGALSFRLNEPVTMAGVRIDNRFFRAYKGNDGIYRVLFAMPFNVDHPRVVEIEAKDLAGNRSVAGFAYRIFPRRKKEDRINIPDSFLRQKMPGFESRFPEVAAPSLIATFIKVNHLLRKKNNGFLLSLCGKSIGKILFSGKFIRFKGAQKSGFADKRHYFYHGREVDQAYHMGVDIASIAHAKVPAANNGRVVFSDYNGIYGNTIVIDHGMGLMSLYAHLSEMMVHVGQEVQKGQIIGITDSTGLAGGDHLHCGMMLGGVFVNPVEWWDSRWIRDHITYNLYIKPD